MYVSADFSIYTKFLPLPPLFFPRIDVCYIRKRFKQIEDKTLHINKTVSYEVKYVNYKAISFENKIKSVRVLLFEGLVDSS